MRKWPPVVRRVGKPPRIGRVSLAAPSAGSSVPTIPPADWRMPATVTTSAGLSGSQAALQAAQDTAASKSRPSFAVSASATEYVEWAVGASETALLLSFVGATYGTITVAIDGVDQAFAFTYPSGSNELARRQFVKIAAGGARTIRLTCAAGAATRTIYPLLHQLPAEGPWDAHVVMGASREAQGLPSRDIENAVIALHPTRDPLIFNYARSSQTVAWVASVSAAAATTYAGVATYAMLGSLIGNDVTAGKPYDSGEKAAIDASLDTVCTALSGFILGFGNTSFRLYSGIDVATQIGGSREYNDAVVHPKILQYAPDCYDTALGRARIDEYLTILKARSSLTDEVHGAAVAQQNMWASTWFVRVYTGGWPTSEAAQRVVEAEAAATVKATALSTLNEAKYSQVALTASSAKTSLQNRINTIEPTSLFYEAVRLIDVAAAAITSGTKSAAQTALTAAISAGYTGGTPPNTATDQQNRINDIVILEYSKTVKLSFGTASALAGWNRTLALATLASPAIADLLKDDGASSGWAMNVTNVGTNSTQTQPGSSPPDFPPEVLAAYATDTANNLEIQITGLDNGKLYDITQMAYRVTTAGKAQKVRVNGVDFATQVDAANNLTTPISITNVAPVAGVITLGFFRGTGSSFVYLNGLIIKERV